MLQWILVAMNSGLVYHGNRLCQYEACGKSRGLNLHEEVKKGADGKGCDLW